MTITNDIHFEKWFSFIHDKGTRLHSWSIMSVFQWGTSPQLSPCYDRKETSNGILDNNLLRICKQPYVIFPEYFVSQLISVIIAYQKKRNFALMFVWNSGLVSAEVRSSLSMPEVPGSMPCRVGEILKRWRGSLRKGLSKSHSRHSSSNVKRYHDFTIR